MPNDVYTVAITSESESVTQKAIKAVSDYLKTHGLSGAIKIVTGMDRLDPAVRKTYYLETSWECYLKNLPVPPDTFQAQGVEQIHFMERRDRWKARAVKDHGIMVVDLTKDDDLYEVISQVGNVLTDPGHAKVG